MSSINKHPTFSYSQPEEYHFSHDSVFMARQVYEIVRDQVQSHWRGLDLCAGCGIIGLDFIYHLRDEGTALPDRFDFLEVQNIFHAHLKENFRRLGTVTTAMNILALPFEELRTPKDQESYDLIVCNPPYFHVGMGKPSSNPIRNRCHFLSDQEELALIHVIANVLKPKGSAFLLFPDLSDHGIDRLNRLREILGYRYEAKKIADIRKTDLYQIKRL